MQRCFVIQPFSSKFDKIYDDIYKPALEEAGLKAYRVDQDPGTEKPIESIEKEIRNATICLADITTDNPNVWYELGYAFAMGRSVLMVCSSERDGRYPFDIHHRTVIRYTPESVSDFQKLRGEISRRAKALLVKITEPTALVEKTAERQPIEAGQIVPTQDLKPAHILVLKYAAAETKIPGHGVSPSSLRESATRAGLTELGFTVALQGLKRKGFLEINYGEDEYAEYYETVIVTDIAWAWIDNNDSQFSLFRETKQKDQVILTEEDIPF